MQPSTGALARGPLRALAAILCFLNCLDALPRHLLRGVKGNMDSLVPSLTQGADDLGDVVLVEHRLRGNEVLAGPDRDLTQRCRD